MYTDGGRGRICKGRRRKAGKPSCMLTHTHTHSLLLPVRCDGSYDQHLLLFDFLFYINFSLLSSLVADHMLLDVQGVQSDISSNTLVRVTAKSADSQPNAQGQSCSWLTDEKNCAAVFYFYLFMMMMHFYT